jgi:transposase
MAYRTGDRNQNTLFPQSIEDYVALDAPVRAYDQFVEVLDFTELGIEINSNKVGNSSYHPKAMLKLLLYGYSYGVRSSRKLEQETHNNLTFIWLMGGLKPDFKTISEFRRTNKKALTNVLKQCARLCVKLNLIAGNVLFIDGTKIRANAGRSQSHDSKWYKEKLAKIDEHIEQLLEECEAQDQSEEGLNSFVAMDKELKQSKRLKQKIQLAFEELKSSGKKKVNLNDQDCAIMHSRQGSHASYNVQSVADDKHGLLIHTEPVNESNDRKQFSNQVDAANHVLKKSCEVASADAGYANTDELEKVDGENIKVIVPSQQQALHEEEKPFSKNHFIYDKSQNCYFCPEGNRLTYKSTNKKNGKITYRIEESLKCRRCVNFGTCTNSKGGRSIIRLKNEEVKERLEALYKEPSSQEIYARRKEKVELPFGHIKRNLKVTAFLLRGLKGAHAEISLLATCFNMARMISILGITNLKCRLITLSEPTV